MTPSEKAKELVDKYMECAYVPWHGGSDEMTQEEAAKEAATICVDEILAELPDWKDADEDEHDLVYEWEEKRITYWQSVKTEIQKL
jgi:hypothetical protein